MQNSKPDSMQPEDIKKMENEAKTMLEKLAKASPEDLKIALATLRGMVMALDN